MKVLACVEFHPDTEACTAQAWIDPPTLLPPLSAEDGAAIGIQLVWVYATVKAVVLIREAFSDRIGS